MDGVEKVICCDRGNNDARLELSQQNQTAALIAALKTTTTTATTWKSNATYVAKPEEFAVKAVKRKRKK